MEKAVDDAIKTWLREQIAKIISNKNLSGEDAAIFNYNDQTLTVESLETMKDIVGKFTVRVVNIQEGDTTVLACRADVIRFYPVMWAELKNLSQEDCSCNTYTQWVTAEETDRHNPKVAPAVSRGMIAYPRCEMTLDGINQTITEHPVEVCKHKSWVDKTPFSKEAQDRIDTYCNGKWK